MTLYRRKTHARGFILITVMWAGLALLLAVAAFLAFARQDALAVRAEVNAARAAELARSGLNLALADLGRVNSEQLITPRDGTPNTVMMAEGRVTYRIFDESGKIDILLAPSRMVAPTLVQVAELEELDSFDAVNIADIIANLASDPEGNIRSVYGALTAAGVRGETAQAASRYLTTLNLTPQVNPMTAPPAVLQNIPGLGAASVEEIMAIRGTDRPLPVLGSASIWLTAQEGPIYTIEAEAELTTGGRALLRVQVASRGLSFRGGRMQFDVLSYNVVR